MPPPGASSLLTPIGYQPGDCGYCKSDSTSGSYYVTTKRLSVDVYQGLIDRGWRRSGTLLYKPDIYRACCPHYTIRLPAKDLITTRDQRQALNRWNKFVLGEEYIRESAKRFPKTKEEKARERNGFDLLQTVHEAEIDRLKPVGPAHRFEVTLEPDNCTDEKFELYKNYQVNVHHDKPGEVTKRGFERFLCKSPLSRRIIPKDGKNQLLGSYHQCYRLDGRLIAIGVLDLLPHAVSGVYFIYHQDFEKWSFGKLSALREAALALENGYEYYYMGFYIHECVKMRYKGDYKPQFVLDPETNEWNPLDGEVRELMNHQKYVSLSRERRKKESGRAGNALQQTPEEEQTGAEPPAKRTKDDEEPPFPMPKPVDVFTSERSLFEAGMPGLISADKVQAAVDLDKLRIHVGQGLTVHCEDLVAWQGGSIMDNQSIKGIVGEFVACVGPEVAEASVLDFSRE